jgi:hypothetical protein
METGTYGSLLIISCILLAGCIQLPGIHILENTPDPVIGQWIGGEPPASDLHVIMFENQSYYTTSFYLNQGEKTEQGHWTKREDGQYQLQSVSGNVSSWVFDPSDDSLYLTGLPQKKYYRYKG